jgi:hypothetical protein
MFIRRSATTAAPNINMANPPLSTLRPDIFSALFLPSNPFSPITMISASTLAALLALGHGVLGQQAGTSTAETHPPMSYQKCTSGGQCSTVATNIVLDANWRWLHSTSGYTNCYTGNTFDKTLCPNNVQCAANCALDGAGELPTDLILENKYLPHSRLLWHLRYPGQRQLCQLEA